MIFVICLSGEYPFSQLLQQQQTTITIASMITQVQLSSKMWHKQLEFICSPPDFSIEQC
jgi:hypothetical protein